MKKSIIKLYFDGAVVLIGAIAINMVAKSFGVTTWFEFAIDISQNGFAPALTGQTTISLVFLLLIYPLILGLLVRISYKY